MKKDIFSKVIEQKSVLAVNDLSPEEKRSLSALMIKYGATAGFTYDRFFQTGFARWELDGITKIKADFLKLHEREMLESGGDDGKGYAFALSLDDSKGGFWRAIGQTKGLITQFKDYMRERGMMSPTTVIKRFSDDDWKRYELRGVDSIIREFCNDDEVSEGQALEVEKGQTVASA